MMLANTEEVEIDAVSDLDFLKEASHPIGTRGHFPVAEFGKKPAKLWIPMSMGIASLA